MDTMLPAAQGPTTRSDRWFTDRVVPDRLTTSTHSRIGVIEVMTICALVVANAVQTGSSTIAVPIAAAIAIAISVVRWVPTHDDDVQRPTPAALAALMLAIVFVISALVIAEPSRATALQGPLITASYLSAYLSCWGFRSLFLLRRVVLLSVLCWAPVAAALMSVTERSIVQLSDLVYQRLAAMPSFAAGDHPWRLFSAMSFRGADAVIAAVVIGVAATRRRVSVGVTAQLAATAIVALVVHHALVLAAPIDDYEPGMFVRVVTAPWVGIVLAVASVGVVGLFSQLQSKGDQPIAETNGHSTSLASDRDPVIFGVGTRHDGTGLLRLLHRFAICAPCVLIIVVMLAVRATGR